ncbi:MAG TPA: hypothetical protein PLZ15_00535 [Melioribacteraceae bacterium]|nr:hypothetical protein [Melioribacteraceae bacterium]
MDLKDLSISDLKVTLKEYEEKLDKIYNKKYYDTYEFNLIKELEGDLYYLGWGKPKKLSDIKYQDSGELSVKLFPNISRYHRAQGLDFSSLNNNKVVYYDEVRKDYDDYYSLLPRYELIKNELQYRINIAPTSIIDHVFSQSKKPKTQYKRGVFKQIFNREINRYEGELRILYNSLTIQKVASEIFDIIANEIDLNGYYKCKDYGSPDNFKNREKTIDYLCDKIRDYMLGKYPDLKGVLVNERINNKK